MIHFGEGHRNTSGPVYDTESQKTQNFIRRSRCHHRLRPRVEVVHKVRFLPVFRERSDISPEHSSLRVDKKRKRKRDETVPTLTTLNFGQNIRRTQSDICNSDLC